MKPLNFGDLLQIAVFSLVKLMFVQLGAIKRTKKAREVNYKSSTVLNVVFATLALQSTLAARYICSETFSFSLFCMPYNMQAILHFFLLINSYGFQYFSFFEHICQL